MTGYIYLTLKKILPDHIWKKICPHRWGGNRYLLEVVPGTERHVLCCSQCFQTIWSDKSYRKDHRHLVPMDILESGKKRYNEIQYIYDKPKPEHIHCWHSTGRILTSDPPYVEDICCYCGQLRSLRLKAPILAGEHGPFAPGKDIFLQRNT